MDYVERAGTISKNLAQGWLARLSLGEEEWGGRRLYG